MAPIQIISRLQSRVAPSLRGAIFYAMYWGVVGMMEPFLNVYYLSLGIDAARIGWLSAVLPFCTLAVAPLVARLADHTRRRVTYLALLLLGLGMALSIPTWPFFKPGFAFLIGFVALYAIFRSPIVALADSLVASMAERHALNFGSMRLWGSFFFTLTATGLGAVWAAKGYSTMFISVGLAFIPVAFAALLLEEPAPKPPAEPAHAPKQQGLVMETGVVFLLCATFLVIGSLQMTGTFGTVYMQEIGGNGAMVGAVMGIAALGEVPGMLFGRRISRKLGDTSALILGYALMGAGMAGYALTASPWWVLAFSLLRGLGFGQVLVSTIVIINARAPQGYASTYQGILNAACWGLAPLIGGPIGGWIYQFSGSSALFLTTAGLTGVAALLILPTYRIWRGK